MKKYILIIALISFYYGSYGQKTLMKSQIEFIHNDLASAKQLAIDQNKFIFIDAYTTWCGPCKAMSRNVFTKPNVANYFNSNFINVKINMEKPAGKKIRGKYDVRAYPTLLFITPEGKLLKKALGYHQPNSLINLGKAVLDKR